MPPTTVLIGLGCIVAASLLIVGYVFLWEWLKYTYQWEWLKDKYMSRFMSPRARAESAFAEWRSDFASEVRRVSRGGQIRHKATDDRMSQPKPKPRSIEERQDYNRPCGE
jgi:hypothetical protein